MNKSILLIGKPHSSKTVFLTQLYSRLQKGKSQLSLYKPVDDLSAIAAAREALSNGEEPQSTPSEINVKLNLPISIGNDKIDLVCPDSGGEQVNHIIQRREVNAMWKASINESNNWVLFIRLNSVNGALDLSNITVGEHHLNSSENHEPIPYSISEQVSYIELLQILLFVKGHDYHFRNESIKLTVVLTCWDEMESILNPKDELSQRLPLLLNFIESNWSAEKLNIIGLSALGFSLSTNENREKYQYDGPENYGYLILSDGQKDTDITQLIAQAI